MARRHAEVPKECLKAADSVSAWRSVVRWTENLFSLHRADSLCAQYYKDMMVDPFWEVAPLEAVAESLSKFFLIPLGHIGEHLGIFFRRLFAELPIQLWIPVTIAVICGFLTLLFFQRNYDFSLLYGLIRLGPPIPQPAIERRRSRSRDLSAPQLTAAVEKHGELRSRSKSQNRSNSQSRSVPANMQIIKPVEIEQTGTLTEQSD